MTRGYKPEDTWHECKRCGQLAPPLNLFLCKGKMMCEGCFMTETKGNTIYIDESNYPRKKDMFGNYFTDPELRRMYGDKAFEKSKKIDLSNEEEVKENV